MNGKCVGAVSISSVFKDTVSLATCGPALLDYSQGKAYVSHPMIGAMRLTKVTVHFSSHTVDSR